jgi:cytochrome P450
MKTWAKTANTDFFRAETLTDPYGFYEQVRAEHPVLKTGLPGFDQDVYLVTSYELVKQVFNDPQTFSSQFVEVMMQGAEPHPEADALYATGVTQGSLLLNLDEPDHKRYRELVSTVFTPKQVSSLVPKMEQIMDDLIDDVIDVGTCDFVNEIAVPFPIYVIADMLGIERTHYRDLKRWSDAFLLRLSQQQSKAQDIAAIHEILEFQRFIAKLIAERRANPCDDLISHIVQAHIAGTDPLSDRETLILIQEIAVAGNETTRNTLIGGFGMLLAQPNLIAILRAQPALIGNAVEEILRLFSSVAGMWRIATRDVELGGVEIPAGSIVMVRMEAANHDPSQFPDPYRLNLERKNSRYHMTFGTGIHYCLGNMLARRELNVAIGKLVSRLDNPHIISAGTDLGRPPNVLLRGVNALRIAFDNAAKAAVRV